MGPEILSSANERIKRLARLQQSRKARDRERLFVVEEPRVLQRALGAGWNPVEIYATQEMVDTGVQGPVEPTTVAESALSRASYRKQTTGLIALFEYLDTGFDSLPESERSVFLVSEAMEKPGNLGAMLRIADGAGLAGVILADPVADLFNPNVVRTSTGAIFSVPMAAGTTRGVIDWLVANKIRSIAMTADGTVNIWEVDMTGKCAIWIGAEAHGLSRGALDAATITARIPMSGLADSLNASASAAIAVYESVRQLRSLDSS